VLAGLVAACAAAAVAGCGGDDKAPSDGIERVYTVPPGGQQTTPQDVPVNPAPSEPPTPTSTSTTPAPTPTKPPSTTETVPGGSEPARTELTFTASSAGIKPRKAGVAPYVAVKVSLVSADRSSHTLTIAGRTLKVGGTRKSEFVTLPGLRPGASYRGRVDGKLPVTVTSTSEPGP
jgi:hypothetical protein